MCIERYDSGGRVKGVARKFVHVFIKSLYSKEEKNNVKPLYAVVFHDSTFVLVSLTDLTPGICWRKIILRHIFRDGWQLRGIEWRILLASVNPPTFLY